MFSLRFASIAVCVLAVSCTNVADTDGDPCAGRIDHDRILCIGNVAEDHLDASLCDTIQDSYYATLCRDSVLRKLSKEDGDASLCDRMSDDNGRQNCLFDLGVAANNPEPCNDLSEDMKGLCLANIAEKTDNLALCESITSAIYRTGCIKTLGIARNDTALCGKITDAENDMMTTGQPRDYCYLGILQNSKDSALCEKVSDALDRNGWNNRNACYTQSAVLNMNIALCEKITNPQQKNTCVNSVSKL